MKWWLKDSKVVGSTKNAFVWDIAEARWEDGWNEDPSPQSPVKKEGGIKFQCRTPTEHGKPVGNRKKLWSFEISYERCTAVHHKWIPGGTAQPKDYTINQDCTISMLVLTTLNNITTTKIRWNKFGISYEKTMCKMLTFDKFWKRRETEKDSCWKCSVL